MAIYDTTEAYLRKKAFIPRIFQASALASVTFMAGSSATKIPLYEAEEEVNNNGLYTANQDGGVTVSEAGIYRVSAKISFNSPATAENIEGIIRAKNAGGSLFTADSVLAVPNGKFQGSLGITPRLCEIGAGGSVYLYARAIGSGNVTVDASNYSTVLIIEKMADI